MRAVIDCTLALDGGDSVQELALFANRACFIAVDVQDFDGGPSDRLELYCFACCAKEAL